MSGRNVHDCVKTVIKNVVLYESLWMFTYLKIISVCENNGRHS